MNKLVRVAMIVASLGATLSFVGCGGNIDDEYEKLLREMAKGNNESCRVDVSAELKKFKAMSPEQKAKELKSTKEMFEAMK